MKLDDRLYSETDDSCSLCRLGDVKALTIHHIDDDPSHNAYENMIVLCHNCHQRFHQSKGITTDDIKRRKRHLIHKTVTTYGVNAMRIASRNNFGVVVRVRQSTPPLRWRSRQRVTRPDRLAM